MRGGTRCCTACTGSGSPSPWAWCSSHGRRPAGALLSSLRAVARYESDQADRCGWSRLRRQRPPQHLPGARCGRSARSGSGRCHRAGTAVRFSRWLDGIALASRPIYLHQGLNDEQAGFQVSHPISVRFSNGAGRPVPLSAVKRITMANSLGQRYTFAPDRPPDMLSANRIVRDRFGLYALPIRYSVRDVMFGGANVVYGGSQSFFVREHRTWTVRLLLFPMRIEVRDALFGFGVGSAVRVRLVGGSSRTVRLGSGHAVTLSGMPRATYDLVATGPGIGLSSPATLTKPLVARLLLLSWVDFAAVGGFALLFVVGLPLVGGRIKR